MKIIKQNPYHHKILKGTFHEEQSRQYKEQVLIPNAPKISIEAGVTIGWSKYLGDNGVSIGLNRFGASAPGNIVYDKLGFNVDNVVKRTLELLKK